MSCLSTFGMCAVRGDTFRKPLTLSTWNPSTDEYEPTDLTGVTAEFVLGFDRSGMPLFTYASGAEITFPNPTAGELLISVPASETQAWHARAVSDFKPRPSSAEYEYQLRLTWPDGTVETILTGTLEVLLAVAE